jgi:large subunit ribosomal protein L3
MGVFADRRRVGLIAKKLGMSMIYDKNGCRVPVTLLGVEENVVTAVRDLGREGCCNVQLSSCVVGKSKVSKSTYERLNKMSLAPMKKAVEFTIVNDNALAVGSRINLHHFVVGQFVDVSGITIGKGMAGVMKRHGFRGLEASHGVSITHRSHGSTGNRQDPGRVFKGKKMAGRMGGDKVTIQNLSVVDVDDALGIIAIKGAVPGCKGSFVVIRDAVKKLVHNDAPHPASLVQS